MTFSSVFRWAQSDVESIHFASVRSSICTLRLDRFATRRVAHAAIRHLAGAGWFFSARLLGTLSVTGNGTARGRGYRPEIFPKAKGWGYKCAPATGKCLEWTRKNSN
ncbi:hypothetical protein EMIT0196P_60289 [Pseudomonas chlororaphis]